ncbi:MAG TPA: hypothetical protein VLX92_05105 [Kofleriaceae bacterium]|nr:hypothetical protein [Kofleriaceae bacterium]
MARVAHADPTLAALAPAPDALASVALGPHGEAYEPDGKGDWLRRRGGELAGDVVAAALGVAVIAATHDGPPFSLGADEWSLVYLAQHARAVLGAGPRATCAVGTLVFALDHRAPEKLPDAPAPVTAIAASATGIAIATELGVLRLDRATWKPIKTAPARIAALLSDRFALVEHGVVELATGKLVAWPSGLAVSHAQAIGDRVIAAATTASHAIELLELRAGKLDRTPVALDPPAPVVGLAADRAGRVVLALRDGRLAVRDHGRWSIVVVRDERPPDRPGSPPAQSE